MFPAMKDFAGRTGKRVRLRIIQKLVFIEDACRVPVPFTEALKSAMWVRMPRC